MGNGCVMGVYLGHPYCVCACMHACLWKEGKRECLHTRACVCVVFSFHLIPKSHPKIEARERLVREMEDGARARAEAAEAEGYRLKGMLVHMEHVVGGLR